MGRFGFACVFFFISFSVFSDSVIKESSVRGVQNSPHVWRPAQMDTTEAVLSNLVQVWLQLPKVEYDKYKWDFDILKSFLKIPRLLRELGPNARSLAVTNAGYIHTSYTETPWEFDPELLPQAKEELKGWLSEIPNGNLQNLGTDFSQAEFRDAVNSWIALVPLLYQQDGSARFGALDETSRQTLTQQIDGFTFQDLDEKYVHLWHWTFFDQLASALSTRNNSSFQQERSRLERLVNGAKAAVALRPRGASTGVKTRFLSLEEVHPLTALLRNWWVLDCSGRSSRYYSLAEGVKFYAIRKGRNRLAKPSAWMAVYEAGSGERATMLVMGMGGKSLIQSDWVQAMRLASVLAGASSWYTFAGDGQPHLEAMINARNAVAPQASQFSLPAWWETILLNSAGTDAQAFTDYFAKDQLRSARLANAEQRSAQQCGTTVKDRFSWTEAPQALVQETPIIARAMMAARLVSDTRFNPEVDRALQNTFHISSELMATARPFFDASIQNLPNADAFYQFVSAGAKLSHLRLGMDPYTVLVALTLYYSDPRSEELVPSKDWQQAFSVLAKTLRYHLSIYDEDPQTVDHYPLDGNFTRLSWIAHLLTHIPDPFNELTLTDVTNDESIIERIGSNALSRAERFELAAILINTADETHGQLSFQTAGERQLAILKVLGLTQQHWEQWQALRSYITDGFPPAEQFTQQSQELRIGLFETMRLYEPNVALRFTIHLWRDNPKLLGLEGWRRLFKQTQRRLIKSYRKPLSTTDREALTEFLLDVPYIFSLLHLRTAMRHGVGAMKNRIVTHLNDRIHWDDRVWDAITETLGKVDLSEDEAERSAKTLLVEALATRRWSERFFASVARNMEVFAGYTRSVESNDFEQTYANQDYWYAHIVRSAERQSNWTLDFWESITECIETSAPGNFRNDLLRLLLSRDAFPEQYRARLIAVLEEENDPAFLIHSYSIRDSGDPQLAYPQAAHTSVETPQAEIVTVLREYARRNSASSLRSETSEEDFTEFYLSSESQRGLILAIRNIQRWTESLWDAMAFAIALSLDGQFKTDLMQALQTRTDIPERIHDQLACHRELAQQLSTPNSNEENP